MNNSKDIFNLEDADPNNGKDSDKLRNESTLRRQIAYDLAIERIRVDIARKRRPLPVLFDENGFWVF